jgi:hypothetical protein
MESSPSEEPRFRTPRGSNPVGPASTRVRNLPLNGEKHLFVMVGGQLRRTSKYAHLLEEDPAFRAWLANVVRASHNTGGHYFLKVGFICDEVYHIPPSGIAVMNTVELMTFVSNVISELEERGAVGTTINSYVKAVKSWARFDGKRLDEKVNVPESENMYAGEVVPRPDEVQTLLDHAPLRVKVAVSLMAFAGLRPGTIGDSRGLDGLKVKDLPEMEVRDGRIAHSKVPVLAFTDSLKSF